MADEKLQTVVKSSRREGIIADLHFISFISFTGRFSLKIGHSLKLIGSSHLHTKLISVYIACKPLKDPHLESYHENVIRSAPLF
jgi:hypothetical protein